MRIPPDTDSATKPQPRVVARQTGKPFEEVSADMERDYWMNAEEAIAYGITSRIISSHKDLA